MALYQQARPITFAQVIGQDHVKDVLMAAIAKNRIGHAYLFSGPRGVGKTTSARLLAMAVNCERKNEIDVPPCGTCESCRLVQAGNHPDVIELDAASNNSVEDVRDLREKVRLASIRGGMRVWILDEAHMLSKAAANALLKTLEEPPANLIFILATTEPERLPPTILSRCQHYRFRRFSEQEIASKLEQLAQKAQVEVQPEAMKLIARAADGAMRDGESLLERLLSTGDTITVEVAEDALGLPPQGRMEELATALAKDDVAQMLQLAGNLYQAGFAPRSLAERLKITLRDALYAAVGVKGYSFMVMLEQAELLRAIHALDDGMDAFVRHDDLLSLESILIKTRNTICKNVPSDASFQAAPVQVMPTQASQSQSQATAKPALPDFNPTGARTATNAKAGAQRDARASRPSQQTPAASRPSKAINWHDVQRKANGKLKAFMRPAQADIAGNHLTLTFEKKSKFHYEKLLENRHELEQLLQQHYGEQAMLTIVSPEGKRTSSQATSNPVSNPVAVQHVTVPEAQKTHQSVPASSENLGNTQATTAKPTHAQQQSNVQKGKAERATAPSTPPVAQASKPQAVSKPPELQQVVQQNEQKAQTNAIAQQQATENSADMGYSAVQYSGEESLPPDFWDSPPLPQETRARAKEKTAAATPPKKTQHDVVPVDNLGNSVEESLPPDFWDTPVEASPSQGNATHKPTSQNRKILSAAASDTKGIALADVLRHFPGRVTEEALEDREEETVEAALDDEGQDNASKTSGKVLLDNKKGVLEPIASSDAITDINAIDSSHDSARADGVTADEARLELDSATTKDIITNDKTHHTPETLSEESPETSAQATPEEAAKNDVPKEKRSDYAQSLF